jgi:hypothetical protein
MNTLSKDITKQFFKDENGYAQLRARWSELMQDKEARKQIKTEHHILYSILIGRDWRKCIGDVRDEKKINNGYISKAYFAFCDLMSPYHDYRHLIPFKGIVNDDVLKIIREITESCISPYSTSAYVDPRPETAYTDSKVSKYLPKEVCEMK